MAVHLDWIGGGGYLQNIKICMHDVICGRTLIIIKGLNKKTHSTILILRWSLSKKKYLESILTFLSFLCVLKHFQVALVRGHSNNT